MPTPKAELMARLYARRRAERLASMPPRRCPVCGRLIPATARADARTCSTACRSKLHRAWRREVYFAIRRWLEDGPDRRARQFDAEGITFSVRDSWYGVRIEADDGGEHLNVEIARDGVTYWHARAARLERTFWATARRL